MLNKKLIGWCLLLCTFLPAISFAQAITIQNNAGAKQVVFGNEKMKVTLDYKGRAVVSSLVLNGQSVLDATGIYSLIKTHDADYSTLHLTADPSVKIAANTLTVDGITYGDKTHHISETWKFTITANDIKFDVARKASNNIAAEQVLLPSFTFSSINTWEGAYQDYGGLAWFYLFNKASDTYGVYSSASRFWNSKTGNGLSVKVDAPGNAVAMSYTRTADDKLLYSVALSASKIVPRFDSGTNRRLYLRDSTDVWSPVKIAAGTSHQSITLSYFNFNEQYGRGTLTGINGDQVSAVLNTIARIGVIGKQHFGGNSWHTPYGPICLHEQYIAQMGLAINDKSYLSGYQQCLDFYRDHAIKPDGRVWSRWAYTNEDIMPGEVNDKGFYEAQWGYLMDSNPDLVTNVSELYDQTGDKTWVKTHQQSCEKALDWILKRDTNNNGLVEMLTDNHTSRKSSDWIDIIWASYENAFVNAKLYHALVLWADIEKQLGNNAKAAYYGQFAAKLKSSFNKPVSEGGFWDDAKHCYIHWRDKDGSTHGNNMVTPVNFMAIGYGICDDSARATSILDAIESQMQKEKLFFWPICMYSYEKGEGNDWQFPFPNYENGDIFLSWGSLGVKAYAAYKPELALKYVKNVLAQYAKDGLAFQRYGRVKQDGLGDDILSGNCLSIIGLYQAIYGINPLHNRFYLAPHITPELAGTKIRYNFRDQHLEVSLDVNKYAVSNGQYKIIAAQDFGFFSTAKSLLYFNSGDTSASIKVTTGSKLVLEVKSFTAEKASWTQSSADAKAGKLAYELHHLKPASAYAITVNGKLQQQVKSNGKGVVVFNSGVGKTEDVVTVALQ